MSTQLPQWLDDYICNELKANYCCSNSDMTVIDWDKENVLNYLGTYFPRSYAESYCIFRNFFQQERIDWENKKNISVFDFGCGTGGEIVGLLMVISENLPKIETVEILSLDGNQDALRLLEQIIDVVSSHINIPIRNKIAPVRIDDFYDLSILDSLLRDNFDIIMSFKAICEFVTKECFEKQNAYKHIAQCFLPKLKIGGIMLLVDITTYNNVSQEWLPRMMDQGLSEASCCVVQKNDGYNQTFLVSHSRKKNDVSKVAWRIIKK